MKKSVSKRFRLARFCPTSALYKCIKQALYLPREMIFYLTGVAHLPQNVVIWGPPQTQRILKTAEGGGGFCRQILYLRS